MSSGSALLALPHYSDMVAVETDDPFLIDIVAPIESETLDAAVAAASVTAAQAIAGAIQDLIGSAPTVLDTLQEIAAALGNDPNLAATLTQALALKAPLASPALTGTPTAPTAALGTSTTQLATTSFVAAAVAALVDSSPGALDTLKELAAALGNDPNFATTITNMIARRLRVDAAQSLTGPEIATARANLGLGAGQIAIFGALRSTAGDVDYYKAQHTLSGGGSITWAAQRLKWTTRFLAIPMSPNSAVSGYLEIAQPVANIPAANVLSAYTGARSVSADGVLLQNFEGLYWAHTIGDGPTTGTFWIVQFGQGFSTPSNWMLIAAVNGDDGTLKLGTGQIMRGGQTRRFDAKEPYAIGDTTAAQAIDILKTARAALPTSSNGLASGEPFLNGTFIDFVP